MGAPPRIEADVCIVGAGIVGLAHAHEARARGLRVVVLERSARAVGASVRNFGHGCLAAMADGRPLECALATRPRWIDLAARAELDLWLEGTVVVARREDELAVMEAVSRDPRRGARLLGAREVAELVPIPTEDVIGGLHATLDWRVDPRRAVGKLAALLELDPQALVLWNAPVHEVAPGEVQSARASVCAPIVVLCPGPDFDTLPPAFQPQRPDITRCKLQMLRVSAPGPLRYGPALMTGLSLIRYPGYLAAEGALELRERLSDSHPELLEAGVHLIVTQLPGGDLIVGDSHDYGETPAPFNDESVFELLLREACGLLGADRLEVRQRWHGVYPTAPGDPFLIENPAPGVHLVEVVSGVGMTTALGLAVGVLDQIVGGDRAPEATVSSPRADPDGWSAAPLPSAEPYSDFGS